MLALICSRRLCSAMTENTGAVFSQQTAHPTKCCASTTKNATSGLSDFVTQPGISTRTLRKPQGSNLTTQLISCHTGYTGRKETNMRIINLCQHEDGTWSFRLNNSGCYYTNAAGEGLFYQDYKTGSTKQLIGTCQFSACKTHSGMRRKLIKTLSYIPPVHRA